jgi:mRNA-degrading endonuclease RelE of RelBE toxin-antitoxin system
VLLPKAEKAFARAGDCRIVYQIDARTETVYVVRIAHRKEAYQ